VTRRDKLNWFALGAFSSGAVSLFAGEMLRLGPVIDHSTTSYLVLEEPFSETTAGPGFDPAFIAYRTGEILRECGAEYFETTSLYEDHSPTADLPVIPQNLDALQCVVLRADDEDIAIRSETRWSVNADVTRAFLEAPNAATGE
jgi:hypothetical protein